MKIIMVSAQLKSLAYFLLQRRVGRHAREQPIYYPPSVLWQISLQIPTKNIAERKMKDFHAGSHFKGDFDITNS